MTKRIITISREFGSGGRFIGEDCQRNLVLHIMTRISLGRLQNSLDYRLSIFRKILNYLQRKDCFPMLFQDVILQENQSKIWCMKHKEK